jgi:outer membrane protein OmpA-like peptidoglycan-associated protein
MKKSTLLLFGGLLMMVLQACATSPPTTSESGNPGALIEQFEQEIDAARQASVDVLAPAMFKSAAGSLDKAKQGLARGAKLSTITADISAGRATLQNAEEIAEVSRTILRNTNAARDKALKAGAEKLGQPYTEVNNQYLALTRAIENDNLSYAQKNAAKVQAVFREVEIMAIKHNALGDARQRMADVERTKIANVAPRAYADAAKALKEADVYIEKNPYADEEIAARAAQAEFMVERAMKIGQSATNYQRLTPEASALFVEGLLSQVAAALDAGDLRNQSAEDQVSRLTAAADDMQRSHQARQDELAGSNQALAQEKQILEDRVADLEMRMSGLKGYSQEQEAAKRKLAAEREFNQRYDAVQRYFSPDEAEVYKQAGQLVIRLREIKFPVGQSTLTPDNYTLLSKVQQAIETFGQSQVTIEGHTDSTGSATNNLLLSQQRAEAVKVYLVANKTLPADMIRAVGFGPDRPLAPNTTPEGRAANRRIDVLIKPLPAK